MSDRATTESRIFREEGKPYWTGELRHVPIRGQLSVEVYTGRRKSDVRAVLSRRRREVKINDKIMMNPFLTFPELAGLCMDLIENKSVRDNFGTLDFVTPDIPAVLAGEDDILFCANSLLLSGRNMSETKQFVMFIYSCLKRYKAVMGFTDIPSRNFGVYIHDKNTFAPAYFKTNERNRVMKEALRIYGESKPYYNLGSSVMFMMYTGLTPGELASLKTDSSDGDFLKVNSACISFRGDFSDLSGNIDLPFERRILLTKSAKNLIGKVFASLPRYEEMKNSDGASRFKRSISVTYDAVLKNTMLYSKYSKFGLGVLRNTFAFNCIRNGVDISELSVMLGHPNAEFTKTVYYSYID